VTNEVTDADCQAFDGYVQKWQRILNLADWRIERGTKRAKAGIMADIGMDPEARLAGYRIGVNFGAAEVTPDALERTALHELLHVFLFDLKHADGDKSGIEHRLINVLEKLLMEGPR
jgi:hypothetical protein